MVTEPERIIALSISVYWKIERAIKYTGKRERDIPVLSVCFVLLSRTMWCFSSVYVDLWVIRKCCCQQCGASRLEIELTSLKSLYPTNGSVHSDPMCKVKRDIDNK